MTIIRLLVFCLGFTCGLIYTTRWLWLTAGVIYIAVKATN